MATYSHQPNDLTTEMTSNDAPSPNVTSSSSESSTYASWKAFNHTTSTEWSAGYGNAAPWFISFDLGSGNSSIANSYSISSSVNSDFYNYMPKTWTLRGSNNDVDWDIIDTQTDVPVWTSGEMREYEISSPASYRYHRLHITVGHGTYAIIGEIELLGELFVSAEAFNCTSSIESDIEISVCDNLFTNTHSMSIGGILNSYIIECPSPFLLQTLSQVSPQIEVNQSLFTSTGSLYVQPELQLFTGAPLSTTGSIVAVITDPFSVAILPRVYTFTLTGEDDGVNDIVMPIKSFQSRIKSGDPTYLSVVIPDTNYASEINSRLNGDLVVRMGYLSNNEVILSEIISIVDFENITIHNGSTNNTITLDGHRIEAFTPKEINLTGSSYMNITDGKLRYRCTPNLYVRPGDTVNIDDDSFKIENITYSVSTSLETFEVSE